MPRHALFSAILPMFAALAIVASPAIADPSPPPNSCPLTLVSIALGGKSVSGREAMYRLDATVTGLATSAKIQLRVSGGATVVSWSEIDRVDTPSVRKATFWFALPANKTVTAASVSSVVVDGRRHPCMAGDVRLADDRGRVTVYDDSHPHVDLADIRLAQHEGPIAAASPDNSFTSKEKPDYPMAAAEKHIVGDITVGIQIGEDGVAQYAWVVSRVTTDMSTALDQPALYAALHSHYRPPIDDGVAVTHRYRIIYSFRIDDGSAAPRHDPDPAGDYDLCPMVLRAIRLKNEDAQDSNAWYSLDVDSRDSSPVSAVIGIEDLSGHRSGLPWSGVLLQRPTPDDALWDASATFNWSGAQIRSAWIDQVTMSNGKSYSCVPVVDVPDRLLQTTAYPRTMLGAPLPLIPLQTLLPAAFTKSVGPAYPSGRGGVRASGHSTVEVIVDDRGRTREAFVTESSGHPELDLAAVDAAAASTYMPAPSNGVALYEATYRFVP